MTKQTYPLFSDDISAFSRVLAEQLNQADGTPSHLSLMNMVARAAGYQNFQHLRATSEAEERMRAPALAPSVDQKFVEKTLRLFDSEGRMIRWPTKRRQQDACTWAIWAQLPARVVMQEPEVNTHLNAEHHFEDPAILRRMMVSLGMMSRNNDGSDYQRCEVAPPPDAKAIIRLLAPRYTQRA
ncbi:DUF2087 domain-containing protein [Falsihalocynthiibacter sp. SS001]|uniref:DUF2087 domain-containing protein n=1 Tax=Falsihalocynthiibacter sp. SS001 TaxID=3349698 RepID=UPI0036D21496